MRLDVLRFKDLGHAEHFFSSSESCEVYMILDVYSGECKIN